MQERVGYVVSGSATPMRVQQAGSLSLHVPIDRSVGCQNLEQRIITCGPGRSPAASNPGSEDVLYVVRGDGTVTIGDTTYELAPGTAVLVPPGTSYCFHNPGREPLVFVSVLSPQPGRPAPGPGDRLVAPLGHLTLREAAQQELPAGDRRFKLLVTPRMGCHNLTQFVGFIPPGRAPLHTHTYEEVIYIIEGQGMVHIGTGHYPVGRGSSIYLPPLLEHCIENTGGAAIRLLGVFCPAGDPSAKASEQPHPKMEEKV